MWKNYVKDERVAGLVILEKIVVVIVRKRMSWIPCIRNAGPIVPSAHRTKLTCSRMKIVFIALRVGSTWSSSSEPS